MCLCFPVRVLFSQHVYSHYRETDTHMSKPVFIQSFKPFLREWLVCSYYYFFVVYPTHSQTNARTERSTHKTPLLRETLLSEKYMTSYLSGLFNVK